MKKVWLCIGIISSISACNSDINRDGVKDTAQLNKVVDKIDTAIDKGIDTVQARFQDLKKRINQSRDKKDSLNDY